MHDFVGGTERTQHPVYDEEWILYPWFTPGAGDRGAPSGMEDGQEEYSTQNMNGLYHLQLLFRVSS